MIARTNAAVMLALIACAVLIATTQAEALEFYVNGAGSDTNPGAKSRPFASITRARDQIRKLTSKQTGASSITVWIRQGSYNLDEPIIFELQDSGSPDAVITYAAYESEEADWKQHADGVYVCSLASTPLEGRQSNQLFCNGKRMVRARYPNWDFENPLLSGAGYFLCEDGGLTHRSWRPGQLDDGKGKWLNPRTGIVHCFHNKNWGNMQYRIRDVDFGERRINFGEGGWQCQRRVGPGKGRGSSSPYYIENIFEELDAPHEWFLDIEKNLLYFYCVASDGIGQILKLCYSVTDNFERICSNEKTETISSSREG